MDLFWNDPFFNVYALKLGRCNTSKIADKLALRKANFIIFNTTGTKGSENYKQFKPLETANKNVNIKSYVHY